MIIILLSPELAQMEACLDENPEFFMVRLHFYCFTLFLLFIKLDTRWFLSGLVSVQIVNQSCCSFKFFIQESFAYFHCFHFELKGGKKLKTPPRTFRISLKSCDQHVHRTT